MKNHFHRTAFSLLEVLIVISLLSLLLSLILSAIQSIRSAAMKSSCQNQLRQIGLATHHYCSDYGHLSPDVRAQMVGKRFNYNLSPFVNILPYVEQSALHQEIMQANQINSNIADSVVHPHLSTVVKQWICPADQRLLKPFTNPRGRVAAMTSYMFLQGTFTYDSPLNGFPGAFAETPGYPFAAISDGLSNTIMTGERPPPNDGSAGWWYGGDRFIFDPGPHSLITYYGAGSIGDVCSDLYNESPFRPDRLDDPCSKIHLWSLHSGGGNFLFADGSVRFLKYESAWHIAHLIAINDGIVIDPLP